MDADEALRLIQDADQANLPVEDVVCSSGDEVGDSDIDSISSDKEDRLNYNLFLEQVLYCLQVYTVRARIQAPPPPPFESSPSQIEPVYQRESKQDGALFFQGPGYNRASKVRTMQCST